MKSDLTDISCFFHHETDRAILVSDDGDEAKAVWVPKSQVEVCQTDDPRIVTVTLPEWLAQQRGLM